MWGCVGAEPVGWDRREIVVFSPLLSAKQLLLWSAPILDNLSSLPSLCICISGIIYSAEEKFRKQTCKSSNEGSLPLSDITSSCSYQFMSLMHRFTSGSYFVNYPCSQLNHCQCPQPSLPQNECIFCAKIHIFSSFKSIIFLFHCVSFSLCLAGKCKTHWVISIFTSELFLFSSSEWFLRLILSGFAPWKHPSLKDGIFSSDFLPGLLQIPDAWFQQISKSQRISKSPRKLLWNMGTLCCYELVFKNKQNTLTSDLYRSLGNIYEFAMKYDFKMSCISLIFTWLC